LPEFKKPDIAKAVSRLRRKLMKPSDTVTPLYVAETTGVLVDEVFMRGVHRVRPANDEGEELRDVILWLWVCNYTALAPENVAFLSNDGGFWRAGQPHPDVARDIDATKGRLSIYPSIDEFVKKHAPAPSEIAAEWFSEHFDKTFFERESVGAATRELNRILTGTVRDVQIDELKFVGGLLYEVAPGVQFAELKLSLSLSLTNIDSAQGPFLGFGGGLGLGFGGLGVGFGGGLAGAIGSGFGASLRDLLTTPRMPLPQMGQAGPVSANIITRKLLAKADARFSARIKEEKAAEVSLDELKIDQWELFSQLHRTPPKEIPDAGAK
jgi:hypothetical protein